MLSNRYFNIIMPCLLLTAIASKFSLAVNLPLNSDASYLAMIYFDMMDHSNFTLLDWYIPINSYLFTDYPVYWTLAMIMGMSTLTMKLGAFIIFTATALVNSWICGRLLKSRRAALLCLTVIFCLPASVSTYMLTPSSHNGTMLFSYLSFAIFLRLAYRPEADSDASENQPSYTSALWLLLYALTSLAVFSDMYFLVAFWIPLIIAIVIARALGAEIASPRRFMLLLLLSGLSGLTVMLFLEIADAANITIMGSMFADLSVKQSFPKFQEFTLKLFNPFAKTGPGSVICSLINLAVFSLAGIYILAGIKSEPVARIKLYVLFYAAFILCISTCVLFMESSHFRYLAPMMFSSGMIFAYAKTDESMNRSMFNIFLALCILAAGLNLYGSFRYKHTQPGQEIAQFLEDKGFEYGYGSYWDSSIITLLTENRVRTRALNFSGRRMEPNFWMSTSRWYQPTEYRGKTFIIVPEDFNEKTLGYIVDFYGTPNAWFNVEDRLLLTWSYNILRQKARVDLNDNLLMLTGRFVKDPDRAYRTSKRGEQGHLSLSKPWRLSKGDHRVSFELETELKPGETAGYVGIYTTDEADTLIASSPIIAGESIYELEFQTENDKWYTPVVHVNGTAIIRLYDILVQQYRK
jgi:hypothetical protein